MPPICLCIPSYISMALHTSICSPYVMGTFGGHLSDISVSVSTSICFSGHNSHTNCSPSLWVTCSLLHGRASVPFCSGYCFSCSTGLEAYGCMLSFCYHSYNHYSSCECWVVWYFISPHNCYHGPLLDGASSISGRHNVVLLPLLTLRDSRGVDGLATALQQQPQSQMPLQTYANYAMSHPQVSFSFTFEPSTAFFYMCCFLFWCMLSAFRCHTECCIHIWELNHWGLHCGSLLELTHGRYMCNLVMVINPHQECTEWLLSPLL